MSGVQLVAAQALLRHDDPKTTMGIYGHLANQFLRTEVDKLSFLRPSTSLGVNGVTPLGMNGGFGRPVIQDAENPKTKAGAPSDFSLGSRPLPQSRGRDHRPI